MGEKRVMVPSDLSESNIPTQKKPRFTSEALTLKEICTRGNVYQDRYAVQKVMGEGAYGKVLKVTDTKTKKLYAMKIIKDTCEHGSPEFVSERDVLEKIRGSWISTNAQQNLDGLHNPTQSSENSRALCLLNLEDENDKPGVRGVGPSECPPNGQGPINIFLRILPRPTQRTLLFV
ncbi:unnamed protein product [Orchesella dallaii]|uniref:Protein kinase domain-containing protein n=1 Tax=Orchesella dallaii TaxID=48710 RepID=A0ABP1R8R4_9HEXA